MIDRRNASGEFLRVQRNMWENFAEKVESLSKLDRCFQNFGAEIHRYRRNPAVTRGIIANVERDNQIALPEQLKNYYLEFGNGAAGCSYGVMRLGSLCGFRPLEKYTPVAELTQGVEIDEDGYFEIKHEKLTGLLVFEEQGCGQVACVIASGSRANEVVLVSNDGYVEETGVSLLDYCETFYDERLTIFTELRELMATNLTLEEIDAAMQQRFNPPGAPNRVAFSTPDYISSIANAEKPAELFGTGLHVISNGHGQRSWFRQILEAWRRRSSF